MDNRVAEERTDIAQHPEFFQHCDHGFSLSCQTLVSRAAQRSHLSTCQKTNIY